MARTRNAMDKAAHHLRSGRRVSTSDNIAMASSSNSSSGGGGGGGGGGKKKNPQRVKKVGKKIVRFSGKDEIRDFDGVNDDAYGAEDEYDSDSDGQHSSEDYADEPSEEDSDDYYPTKIAKKRDTQKANSQVITVGKTPQLSQKSATKHTKPFAALPSSSNKAIKVICVSCSNAHVKCVTSALPGQPCQRCVKMDIPCVLKRKRGDPPLDDDGEAQMAADETLAHDDSSGNTSSDDPINSAILTTQPSNRRTRFAARKAGPRHSPPAAHTSNVAEKNIESKAYPTSSSSLSSLGGISDDELDITMGSTQEDKQGDVSSIPVPSGSTAFARTVDIGSMPGASTRGTIDHHHHHHHHQEQQQHNNLSLLAPSGPAHSPPMDTPLPSQQTSHQPTPWFSPATSPSPQGKDKGKAPAATALVTAQQTQAHMHGTISSIHTASPLVNRGPDSAASSSSSSLPNPSHVAFSPRTSPPTFLPAGHGSVLNDAPSYSPLQQEQQEQFILPPISQLGQGGAYIGRYDTDPLQQQQQQQQQQQYSSPASNNQSASHEAVTTNTTTPTGYSRPKPRASKATLQPQPTHPPPSAMLAHPGTPAYRYSATKLLLLIKHAQRGTTGRDEYNDHDDHIEDVRRRAIALWHEVNLELVDGEETFDEGGLAFLKGLGRQRR